MYALLTFFVSVLIGSVAILIPFTAFAAPLPAVDPSNPGDIVSVLIQAFSHAQWAWAVGLVFMLATWVIDKFLKSKIPAGVMIWVAVGLATGTSIALGIASGAPVVEAIGKGITAGLAAGGGWSALGKYILPSTGTSASTTKPSA